MAGLYDRINGPDNIDTHYIVASIKGYGTGLWTRATILANINSLIETPLDAAAEIDFAAIADALDGQANAVAKLAYANQIEAAMIASASDVLAESGWRTALEIS